MSKEEWSLKGKLIYYVINKEDGRKAHIEEKDFDSKKWKKIFSLYSRGDIEILRQKLIEDVKRTVPSDEELLIAVLVKRINKRFGVENE